MAQSSWILQFWKKLQLLKELRSEFLFFIRMRSVYAGFARQRFGN